MSFEDWFLRNSTNYFSDYALYLEDYLQDLKENLRKGGISYTLIQYVSIAIMSSVIGFVVLTPLVSVIIGLISGGFSGIIAGLIAGPVVGIFLAIGVAMLFYLYPSIRISQRRDNIDHNLPFATIYLSTIAGMGTPVSAIFQLLGQFEEYGEVSKEARKIANDVYGFGADIDIALSRAAERTPSDKFKDLLWGINSILTTGGDMRSFLREKANSFMNDYRRDLDQFADTLSLLVEMYITVVIVGSVFLIIISTIMSSLGSSPLIILTMQTATIFLLLPMASVMFIVIVKSVSPAE